jgi:hypothetical protein
MKKILFITLLIIFLIANLLAQDSSNSLKYQPAQVTFFYPVGVFGAHSQDYKYSISLNILAGRTGGNNGAEIAGWVNVNDIFTRGFQAAGIGNLCLGTGDAFQAGGIFNLVKKDFNGFQAAGIINAVGGNVNAVQMGGIGNFANGLTGAQFAGILNVSSSSVDGAQFAGISNTAVGNSDCFQTAGIINIANSINGGQIAGIGNVAADAGGLQIGGIFNAAPRVKGFQLAGIVNIAGNVNGMQLASILNICDSIDGVPFALISFVRKNGYRKLEISSNELSTGNISFKTGVRRFYTIFSLGYSQNNEKYNVSYGFGIGSGILLKNQNSAIDIELRSNQLTNNFETSSTLLHNSFIINYSRILFRRFEIFAGPTFNILVANNSLTAVKTAPSWAKAFKPDNRLWSWVGFHAGIRL